MTMRLRPALTALILALASVSTASAQGMPPGPVSCRYAPGEHFLLGTSFDFSQVMTSPDTVLAGTTGTAHIHYVIHGTMLFVVTAVDSQGRATVQLTRQGSETMDIGTAGHSTSS